MAFIKVVKNKSYFKRYQVKYRRRREGKTDYHARRKMVAQEKNKYNSPKYRLVVRFTNRDIICQIVYSKIDGDFVLTSAYGHELPRYGIPVGITNYSSAYAVGLLLARRTLAKLGLADKYQGNTAVNGEDYHVTPLTDGPRPFRAILDVGLRRTSTGTKLFAALKGACDGGIDVPHAVTRFAGYDTEGKKLKADVLRKYIFGGHVASYMKELKEEDPGKYETRFSQYIKNKIAPDGVEKMYAAAHKAIRANPAAVKKPGKDIKEHKRFNQLKLTRAQRVGAVKTKKLRLQQAASKKDEVEEEDEE